MQPMAGPAGDQNPFHHEEIPEKIITIRVEKNAREGYRQIFR
jgi:hypothetical protein